ncbi:tubby C-terminal-like domain-containing protein [Naematelia encephala]|uniref:Tubby C-terminal-like domain-containing protein n=1 Tax=Naematelia encephala TaxID=71784 RepID=A0A1Y2AMS5_9TREE|nr:tubby C-terminal-like domain-containing protein [Naematelia encephala]
MPSKSDVKEWESFNPPLGLDQKRSTAGFTRLTLRKPLSWSSGDFVVEDEEGAVIFKCQGKFKSTQDRVIQDSEGQVVYTLSTRFWSMSRETIGLDSMGVEAFRIKKDNNLLHMKLHATFVDEAREEPITLSMQAKWYKDGADITWGELPVARMRREQYWKDKRELLIAPGVETALIFAMCTVFDMLEMETMGYAIA